MVKETFRAYDRFGNIALVKFPDKTQVSVKKKFAKKLLDEHKSVTTVLEKTGKFKGRLRKQETKWLAGEKTKEAKYTENGCVFRFNIDDTYFSPRLSNERKEISQKIKKGDNVLVMFAGVGPYSIVIARNSLAKRVYSNEINREANKYAELNLGLNKVKDRVILLNGNIKSVADKIVRGLEVNNEKIPSKFDVIVMPRPKLDDSFLHDAFRLSKKGARIYYYDFCKEDELGEVINKIKTEALKSKKKIKIIGKKKAGEIAPYRYRVRVDIRILGSD